MSETTLETTSAAGRKQKPKRSLARRIARLALFAVILFLILIVSGCGIGTLMYYRSLTRGGYVEKWDDDEGRILADLSYGKGDNARYDLYLHKSIDPKTDAPLLLFIHGGSWTSGRRGDMAYACKYYGKKGCITATMEYSLVSKDNPGVTVKTMLDEITACIAALKKQLETEGYHAPKLAIAGFSAGGHLALLYAYSRAQESAIPLAFVFEKVGPVSFHKAFWGADVSAVLIGLGAGIEVNAGNLDDPEIVAAADSLSPVHFIGPDSPPTIFAYGGKDTLVRPVHRNALAKALGEHRVPNRCVDFPNSNHALWDDAESTEVFRQAVLEYCVRYMKAGSPQTEEKFEKR